MRTFTVNVLVTIVSLVITLSVVEGTLRMLDKYPPPDPEPSRPDLYVQDDAVGYHLRPLLDTSYYYPAGNPVAIPLVANSNGYRGRREFSSVDARRRILILGDSFVFGEGVFEEERFTEVLESLAPCWRIDNMGMTGWGIDLMLRALEQTGLKTRPDIVVLAVYTDDFRRVHPYYSGAGYRLPKFELQDGRLASVPYPELRDWQRLRVYQLIYQNLTTNKYFRDRFDINSALLERFYRLSKKYEFKPAIVFFPGRADNKFDKMRRAFLADWASDHSIPYLDLTKPIHDAGVKNVYIKRNWHWNAAGHRIVAINLQSMIRSFAGKDCHDDNGP